MLTTAIRRPLTTAAVAVTAALTLHAAPAHSAQGAERCPGAHEVPASSQALKQAASAIRCLVNAERTSRGLKALKIDGDLAKAARAHSRDMIRNRFFDHTAPDGDTVGDRIRKAGYGSKRSSWYVGENLGWGTGAKGTPNAIVDAWLASPGHRQNMLKSRFRELGVGVVQGAPTTQTNLPGATYTLNLGVIR
jgi:uncharacterized protein YkwD